MRSIRLLTLIALTFGLGACAEKSSAQPDAPAKTPDAPAKATAPATKADAPATDAPATDAPATDAPAAKADAPAAKGEAHPGLMDPSKAKETAPATFKVRLSTTKGDIVIDVTRDWAPNGVDRFYNLVKIGYYDDVAFFRVIKGFMAQVGISGRPELNTIWRQARIQDDPVKGTNSRGMVTFATAGPNSRTSQFFINFGDNHRLDRMGFAPFGKIDEEGMKVVDALHSGYGEGAPRGAGPAQGRLQGEGNAYLRAEFPELDYIKKATIE